MFLWLQRGGRGMQGRGGPAGRVGPGRGGPRPAQDFANRPKPPGVSGSGLQFNRPSGPPIPPPQAPWMGGKGPAPSKSCDFHRKLAICWSSEPTSSLRPLLQALTILDCDQCQHVCFARTIIIFLNLLQSPIFALEACQGCALCL